MATRRYNKKRVSRKGRKVGRKSRRVRRIRGGGLIDNAGKKITADEFPIDVNEAFKFLHGKIRTKNIGFTKYVYTISIEGNSITWTPSQSSFGIAQMGYGRVNALNDFKTNIKAIYGEDISASIEDIPILDSKTIVTLTPNGFKMTLNSKDIKNISFELDETVFKTNVVNFYKGEKLLND
jgi:hypothetical protein